MQYQPMDKELKMTYSGEYHGYKTYSTDKTTITDNYNNLTNTTITDLTFKYNKNFDKNKKMNVTGTLTKNKKTRRIHFKNKTVQDAQAELVKELIKMDTVKIKKFK
jgi:hypothetical protein